MHLRHRRIIVGSQLILSIADARSRRVVSGSTKIRAGVLRRPRSLPSGRICNFRSVIGNPSQDIAPRCMTRAIL
jgi:hypothetical protein